MLWGRAEQEGVDEGFLEFGGERLDGGLGCVEEGLLQMFCLLAAVFCR